MTAAGTSGITVAEAGHAAARAALEAERPPDWWPRRWDETRRGLRAFLEGGWGNRAIELGWRPEELYRPPQSLSGVNRFGVAFLIGDGRVMAVTEESITVEQPELWLKGQQRAAALQVRTPWAGVFQLTAAGEINGDHWAEG